MGGADHRVRCHFTHSTVPRSRLVLLTNVPNGAVSTPNKRLLHSKHGDVSATGSAKFKEPKGQPRTKDGLQGNNRKKSPGCSQ